MTVHPRKTKLVMTPNLTRSVFVLHQDQPRHQAVHPQAAGPGRGPGAPGGLQEGPPARARPAGERAAAGSREPAPAGVSDQ